MMKLYLVASIVLRSWRVSVLGPFLLAIGSAASGNLHQLGPGHFSCNAPAGQYGEEALPALQAQKPVTVRIKYISENFHPKWFATAGIFFDTPKGRMRVEVGKAANDQKHLYVALWHGNNGDTEILDQFPLATDWIEIRLTDDYDGYVQVDSRGHDGTLNLGTPWPVKTVLHCQSGAFEFEVSPPPPPRTSPSQVKQSG